MSEEETGDEVERERELTPPDWSVKAEVLGTKPCGRNLQSRRRNRGCGERRHAIPSEHSTSTLKATHREELREDSPALPWLVDHAGSKTPSQICRSQQNPRPE